MSLPGVSPTETVVVRTTCAKSGGFRKYTKLPNRNIFKNACYVMSGELETRIKRRGLVFDRETQWQRLPVYFSLLKGFLFVYMKEESGYGLRIQNAGEVKFEGERIYTGCGNEKKTHYKAVMKIVYSFGEINFRFKSNDNLRAWRSILLAAHQCPKSLMKVGAEVCKKLHWNDAASILSAHSMKSAVGLEHLQEKVQVDSIALSRRHVESENEYSQQSSANGQQTKENAHSMKSAVGLEHLQEKVQVDSIALSRRHVESENEYSQQSSANGQQTKENGSSVEKNEENPSSCNITDECITCRTPRKEEDDDSQNLVAVKSPGLGTTSSWKSNFDESVKTAASGKSLGKSAKADTSLQTAAAPDHLDDEDNHSTTTDSTLEQTASTSSIKSLHTAIENKQTAAPIPSRRAYIVRSSGSLKNSQIMQFWKTKESEDKNLPINFCARPKAPPRRVTFKNTPEVSVGGHNPRRIVSPTKYYATVEEAVRGCDESLI
uniref:PH domain-containing protein n=1 Tax=Panagrolaimus sp. JU765 TaxID=591449 RepID=A0AC34RJY1_9BILA